MPQRKFAPVIAAVPPAPTLLRVLSNLEKPEGHADYPGVWTDGDIIAAAELPEASIPTLMERGIVMAYIEPAAIESLPEI